MPNGRHDIQPSDTHNKYTRIDSLNCNRLFTTYSVFTVVLSVGILGADMLAVIMMNLMMLRVVNLSIIILSAIMTSMIMLSAII